MVTFSLKDLGIPSDQWNAYYCLSAKRGMGRGVRRRRTWDLADPSELDKCVQECRDGSPEALRVIIEYCRSRVRWAVREAMRSCTPEDWEDAEQVSLAAVVRGFPKFKGDSEPCTWMVTISSRQATRIRDRIESRRSEPLPQGPTAHRSVQAEKFVDLRHNPAEVAEALATASEIRMRLLKLDDISREVFIRRFGDEQRVSDIAREMGYSISWVEKRINLIKQYFRDLTDGSR